jgi:hypothetical protein
MVAVAFSAVTRWFRAHDSAPKWQLAAPFAAYPALLLLFTPYILLKLLFFPGDGNGLQIFTATALLFAAITVYGIVRRGLPRRPERELWPLVARLSFHFYFLGAIFVYGIHEEAPMLLVGALGMIAFEAIAMVPFYLPLYRLAELIDLGKRWFTRRPHRKLTSPERRLSIDARPED